MQQHPHPATVIAEHWADLRAAVRPGTRPRTTTLARHISEATIARDRAERQERSTLARGQAPAPADVPVIDVIRDVTTAVLFVENESRLSLGLTPFTRPTDVALTVPSACSDITVYARMLEPDARQWIVDQLRPAAHVVLRALHLAEDPLTLPSPCPWCGGPLQVHAVSPHGPHVLCAGTDSCDASCSTWLWGRPMWRWDDLPELGDALTPVHGRPGHRPLRVSLVHAERERRKSMALTF